MKIFMKMRFVFLLAVSNLIFTPVGFAELGSFQIRKALKSNPKARAKSDLESSKRILRKLKTSSKCRSVAKAHAHAKDLAKRNFKIGRGKSHYSFSSRIKKQGLNGRVAEINAVTTSPDLERALKVWINSSSHRRQLLNRKNKEYGLGRAKSKNGKYYWVMCLKQS